MPASFCFFSFFLITISIIQIEKSVDSVLGIRTRTHWMVTKELYGCRPVSFFSRSRKLRISCCVLPIKNKFSQNKNGLPDRASIKSHEDFQKLKEKYTTHYCCTPRQELSCASCVFAPSFFNASLNKFLQDYLAPFNVSVKKKSD